MRIVIAPDSFKGSASAIEVAAALARGWRTVRSGDELIELPTADGGEGTIEAMERAIPGATRVGSRVLGPLADSVDGYWLRFQDADGLDTALIELSVTSGLPLLRSPDPMNAHTFGFGQQIAAALDAGVDRLLLAVGGSSSTDGGTGALRALGARFFDDAGTELPLGGGELERLIRADFTGMRSLPPAGADLLSDVRNPLTGALGAAEIFAPQKGADPAQVAALERGLLRLAQHVPVDPDSPGAGAAGGTGFGMLAWGAEPRSGAMVVCEVIGLGPAVADAQLVLTGEGRYDIQTASGKVVHQIEKLAQDHGVPVVVVAGQITVASATVDSSVSLTELAGSVQTAMAEPLRWVEAAGRLLAARYS